MISFEKTARLADAILAKGMLDDLKHYYPDFGHWYVNKCIPDIIVGKASLIVAREHGQIVGIALGKKEPDEIKLRCVRVLPPYQKRVTAAHLIEHMMRDLDCDRPHCTVAEEMLHDFSRLLINLFQFDLSRVDKGRYRKNKLEYVFNAPPR